MATKWGQARVEVHALREEISELLTRGHTLKKVYDELRGHGRLSIGHTAFYVHVNRLRSEAIRDRYPARPQSGNTTRHNRTPKSRTPHSIRPSLSPAPETEGPRIADAEFNRMPVSRDPSYTSRSTADVNPDVWDGKFLTDPEAAS